MKQAVLSQFNLPWLPITALIIFSFCFLTYAYWTFKKSNRKFYEEAALLPLNDSTKYNGGKNP